MIAAIGYPLPIPVVGVSVMVLSALGMIGWFAQRLLVWRAADRNAAKREARRKERVLEALAPVDYARRWDV